MNIRIFMAVVLLAISTPPPAQATVGFAEKTYFLRYNDNADLFWGKHSDLCSGVTGTAGSCFAVIKRRSWKASFYDEDLLVEINIPQGMDADYIIAKTLYAGTWVIYDLKKFDRDGGMSLPTMETADFNEALLYWQELGYPPPRMVNSKELDKHFKKRSWIPFL